MTIRFTTRAAVAAMALTVSSAFAENVKIAFIDPLSGPFGPVGINLLNSWQYAVELANKNRWAGDNTFEIVPFDNKANPQETATLLKGAVDKGFRYVIQGNGSGAAFALLDALDKHNTRNPGKEVVYLNHAAVDPDLTNSKCSFWHFRFDTNIDQKMDAMTTFMAEDKTVKKVYVFGQDYAFGHQVSRYTKDYLKRKRSDIEIVGDHLHPIGQVKDFAPYVAKIKAAGADTVITGNWGPDLVLFMKAAKDYGLNAKINTLYAATLGVPPTMGPDGAGRVRQISAWHANASGMLSAEVATGQKSKFKEDLILAAPYAGMAVLAAGIKKAGTTDPTKVALAMEDVEVQALNGTVRMRRSDHQLQQAQYVSVWAKVDGQSVKYDQEGTGYGWKTEKAFDIKAGEQPTSCQMKRPAS